MRALTSRTFGAIPVDPLALAPVPDTYDGVLAEIRQHEDWLAGPPTRTNLGDRTARRIRLAILIDRRTAMERRAAETPTPCEADVAHGWTEGA